MICPSSRVAIQIIIREKNDFRKNVCRKASKKYKPDFPFNRAGFVRYVVHINHNKAGRGLPFGRVHAKPCVLQNIRNQYSETTVSSHAKLATTCEYSYACIYPPYKIACDNPVVLGISGW